MKKVLEVLRDSKAAFSLSFTKVKPGDNKTSNFKYDSFSVNLSNKDVVRTSLIYPIADYLSTFVEKGTIPYDPFTQKDGEYEVVDTSFPADYPDFMASFGKNIISNYKKRLSNITFYAINVTSEDKSVWLLRRLKGFKTVNSKGNFAVVKGSELNFIDDEVIGLDSTADMVFFDQKIAIITHSAFASLFNTKLALQNQVTSILGPVKRAKKIDNYAKFERMIRSDLRYAKLVANMKNHGRTFTNPLQHEAEAIKTIKDFRLKIKYDQTNHIILLDQTEDIPGLLRLLSDYYYNTTQDHRLGIVDK